MSEVFANTIREHFGKQIKAKTHEYQFSFYCGKEPGAGYTPDAS